MKYPADSQRDSYFTASDFRELYMIHLLNISVSQSPFFFFSNDRDAILFAVSPSVLQTLGFAASELIGRKFTEFLVADHPLNSGLTHLQQKRFNGDGIQSAFAVVLDAAQRKKILKFQTYGESNHRGEVVANHGVAQDVTAIYESGTQLNSRLEYLDAIDSRITAKERQVLDLVLNGRLNKSIARELSVSERAIEMTRARLMNKFNAETTAQLIAKAVELRTLRTVFASRLLVA